MTVSIEATTVDVELAMERFARKMGVSLKDVYVDQMRLANNQLIKLFHPKTAKQGKNRIKRELGSLFIKLGPKDFDMTEQWMEVGGDVPPQLFRTSRGAVFGVENRLMNLRGDFNAMERYHKRNRLKNGRTTAAGSWDKRIGRWKFVDRMVVSRRVYDKYLQKRVFPKVGLLKSGWIARNAPYEIKAPRWVRKAGERFLKHGRYSDQMDLFASGFLKLINLAPHAADREGLVKIAMRTRVRDLQRHASKRIDKLTARWNKGNI